MALSNVFDVIETTIADIQAAYRSGDLSARQLVEIYLDRIEAYDKKGPAINALISLNPHARDEADRLDAAFKRSGPVGPLHGIPVIIKDQADVAEMPTTLGSLLFKGHRPERDCFVAALLKKAGAIFLGKSTLGELGGGDTHGSLFGSTRNVYDLERTAGGSSGGSGASVSANFSTVGVGQEGFASIRRPSCWNGIVGMRPTAGLVSRTGVWGGWPGIAGSLGPMARTVADLATLLDSMHGYDPADPLTARGFGHAAAAYTAGLDKGGLKGARLGVLREPMGRETEPGSDDFKKVAEVFDRAVEDLRRAGAEVVDPVVIPGLAALLAKRANSGEEDEAAVKEYLAGSAHPPYASKAEMRASPLVPKLTHHAQESLARTSKPETHYEFLKARELLMTRLLAVMADHRLDAIVHKTVEHQPTLIKEGVNPPYVDGKGVPHINTFLAYVPSITVPAGFTRDKLPAGITFLGRPHDDAAMIRYAFAYEQATRHRQAPTTTP